MTERKPHLTNLRYPVGPITDYEAKILLEKAQSEHRELQPDSESLFDLIIPDRSIPPHRAEKLPESKT